jgi:hypothetical protein
MAQYEHLPIYQKAMALAVYIEKAVAHNSIKEKIENVKVS